MKIKNTYFRKGAFSENEKNLNFVPTQCGRREIAMSFEKKTVLVTGGGTGIGREIALELARLGANVVINYSRSEKDAEKTCEDARAFGVSAMAVKANVSQDSEVRTMMETVEKEFQSLHYLVNNAGTTVYVPLSDLDAITNEDWDNIFNVNVKGMFFCARAAAPFLRRNEGSSILNIGSVSGISGTGSSFPYAVSKAAVHGFTRSLALALAPDIRVNCIAPGPVETRWWAHDEEWVKDKVERSLLKRVSCPEDFSKLAAVVLEQKGLTGQIISPNNGIHI